MFLWEFILYVLANFSTFYVISMSIKKIYYAEVNSYVCKKTKSLEDNLKYYSLMNQSEQCIAKM